MILDRSDGRSIDGDIAVLLHVLHYSDQGVVLHVEGQLLVEAQLVLLYCLHAHALELQPASALLLVIEGVEAELVHASLALELFLPQEEVQAQLAFGLLHLPPDLVH